MIDRDLPRPEGVPQPDRIRHVAPERQAGLAGGRRHGVEYVGRQPLVHLHEVVAGLVVLPHELRALRRRGDAPAGHRRTADEQPRAEGTGRGRCGRAARAATAHPACPEPWSRRWQCRERAGSGRRTRPCAAPAGGRASPPARASDTSLRRPPPRCRRRHRPRPRDASTRCAGRSPPPSGSRRPAGPPARSSAGRSPRRTPGLPAPAAGDRRTPPRPRGRRGAPLRRQPASCALSPYRPSGIDSHAAGAAGRNRCGTCPRL